MRKCVAVGILIFGLCLGAAAADDTPKVEVFGGVSFLHIDTMGLNNFGLKANYAGWDAEGQFNINKILGVTADIGGNYGRLQPNTPTKHTYTYVFGPTFSIRREHATIFAHTLFGANSTNILTTQSSVAPSGAIITPNSATAFAMAWGGGIDLKLSRTFAVRLGQLDWIYTRADLALLKLDGLTLKDHQNNIRYTGGIVINLGGH
jgi:opacity protein-like surface antigen